MDGSSFYNPGLLFSVIPVLTPKHTDTSWHVESIDGRVPSSPLVDLLFESLKIGKREELIEISVQIQKREWKNPGLSALVDKAAARGDKYAIKILRDAAGCTFDLADSVITKLKLNEEPTFKVGAWGSAIVKSPLHFSCFKKTGQ